MATSTPRMQSMSEQVVSELRKEVQRIPVKTSNLCEHSQHEMTGMVRTMNQVFRPFGQARLYCALDGQSMLRLFNVAERVAPFVDGFKIGLEFFYANGYEGIHKVNAIGKPLYLDFKLLDNPYTVGRAVQAVLPLRPQLLSVHASGGFEMLRTAASAVASATDTQQLQGIHLIGITGLSNLTTLDLADQGIGDGMHAHEHRLAKISIDAGCHGISCLPESIASLRKEFGPKNLLIVQGLRPKWADSNDQSHIMTPAEAARHGANVLVIGRPITLADKPEEAAERVRDEIASAIAA